MKLGGWKGDKTDRSGTKRLKLSTSCPVAFFGTLLADFSARLARSERWLLRVEKYFHSLKDRLPQETNKRPDKPTRLHWHAAVNASTVHIRTNVLFVDIKVTSHVYFVGTADYFALNQYGSYFVTLGETGSDPSYSRDNGVIQFESEEWPVSLTSQWEAVRILI
jgi:hypothetical protein